MKRLERWQEAEEYEKEEEEEAMHAVPPNFGYEVTMIPTVLLATVTPHRCMLYFFFYIARSKQSHDEPARSSRVEKSRRRGDKRIYWHGTSRGLFSSR